MTLLPQLAFTLPFTGFFASLLFGINLLEKPLYLVITLIAAVLPDTGRAGTAAGRMFYPLTGAIQRLSASGAATHNLSVMTALTLIWATLERLMSGSLPTATLFCTAYFGHLVLDMCAREGAPLLYPFNRSPFILVGNPALRLRPEDMRHEVAVTIVCAASAFLLQPFFNKGFRTTYNQSFATLEHLHNEFQRSPVALRVHYHYRLGSTEKEGAGYCVESAFDRATLLLDDGRWLRLNNREMVVLRVFPERSGQRFFLDSLGFSAVRPDSLARLLQGKRLLSLTASGNRPFLAAYGAGTGETQHFKESYLHSTPSFADASPLPDSTGSPDNLLPQINALLREQRFIRDAFSRRLAQYRMNRDSLEKLRLRYQQTDQLPTRERLFESIRNLEKELPPQPDEEKLNGIRIRIRRLEEEAAMKRNALPSPPETRLTGMIRWVIIE